jgi:hypothetical protein
MILYIKLDYIRHLLPSRPDFFPEYRRTTVIKMHLFSFLLAAASFSWVLTAPAPNPDPAPNERGISQNKKRGNFWFAGVNESGAEFGSGNIPGTKGTDYTWPVTSSIDVRF